MTAHAGSAASRLAAAAWTARATRRCLAIDARRPASWLGMACAAGAGCWLAVRPRPGGGSGIDLALWAGGLAALAAVGDPPGAMPAGRRPMVPFLAVLVSRSAWPLAGAVAVPLGLANPPLAVAGAAGVVAAVVSVLVLRRRGADAAEAGGTTLLAGSLAAAAVAAVEATGGRASPAIAAAAAACGWGAVLAAAQFWLDAEADCSGLPAGFIDTVGWPTASGRLGSGLVGASMVAALLAMPAWLFLAPERAGLYGRLAAACFVALAVPRGTLAWGATGALCRSKLLRTSAGPPRRTSAGPPRREPGRGREQARLAGAHPGPSGCRGPEWRAPLAAAAILGWPPLVAALVVGGPEAVERVGLVVSLAVWAAGLGLATVALVRQGVSRETIQAVALTLATASLLASAGWERGKTGQDARGNGVEPTAASCKTPGRPQLSRSPGEA